MKQKKAIKLLQKKGLWDDCIVRSDGRIEWQCSHRIGHTVWYPEGSDAIHGCDGCCKNILLTKGRM